MKGVNGTLDPRADEELPKDVFTFPPDREHTSKDPFEFTFGSSLNISWRTSFFPINIQLIEYWVDEGNSLAQELSFVSGYINAQAFKWLISNPNDSDHPESLFKLQAVDINARENFNSSYFRLKSGPVCSLHFDGASPEETTCPANLELSSTPTPTTLTPNTTVPGPTTSSPTAPSTISPSTTESASSTPGVTNKTARVPLPTSTSSTNTLLPTSSPSATVVSAKPNYNLGTGAKAGIATGVILGLLIVSAIFWSIYRRRKRKSDVKAVAARRPPGGTVRYNGVERDLEWERVLNDLKAQRVRQESGGDTQASEYKSGGLPSGLGSSGAGSSNMAGMR